jgi:hypothetical protein
VHVSRIFRDTVEDANLQRKLGFAHSSSPSKEDFWACFAERELLDNNSLAGDGLQEWLRFMATCPSIGMLVPSWTGSLFAQHLFSKLRATRSRECLLMRFVTGVPPFLTVIRGDDTSSPPRLHFASCSSNELDSKYRKDLSAEWGTTQISMRWQRRKYQADAPWTKMKILNFISPVANEVSIDTWSYRVQIQVSASGSKVSAKGGNCWPLGRKGALVSCSPLLCNHSKVSSPD